MCKLLFDLTSRERALNSLSMFIGRKEGEICSIINRNCFDDNLNYRDIQDILLEELDIDEDELSLEDIEIKSIHVTTGNNDEEFRKNGLLNLREVLRRDTTMSRFLHDEGIKIDIENKLIEYKDKKYSISNEDENNFVYHKLFNDYLINGFHCDENPIDYDGLVAFRPEFINELGKLIKNPKLQYDWKMKFNKCYLIEYKTNPYNYEWFNYQIDSLNSKEEFESDMDYYIKRWLIRSAIVVIIEDIKGMGLPEIFSYARFNYNFSSDEILKITDVTNKRIN